MSLSDFGMTVDDAKYILGSELHSDILEVLAYGMYTVIYCVALYLILSRGTHRSRVRSAILITVMWMLTTAHMTVRWLYIDYVYIRHGFSRETQVVASTEILVPLDVTSAIVIILSVFLADITMIWRCWIIYGRRWLIIIIPVLSLAVGIVAHILRAVWQFRTGTMEFSDMLSTWNIVFLSTTVFTNVFCTVAIIYRLLTVTGFMKALKTYYGLLEILVESAILYTSIYLIQIGLYVHTSYFTEEWDQRTFYAQSLANVITGVAPTLIIARVAAGHARPDDTWTMTMPDMRTTMKSFGGSLHFVQPSRSVVSSTEVDMEGNNSTHSSQESSRTESRSQPLEDSKEKGVLMV